MSDDLFALRTHATQRSTRADVSRAGQKFDHSSSKTQKQSASLARLTSPLASSIVLSRTKFNTFERLHKTRKSKHAHLKTFATWKTKRGRSENGNKRTGMNEQCFVRCVAGNEAAPGVCSTRFDLTYSRVKINVF